MKKMIILMISLLIIGSMRLTAQSVIFNDNTIRNSIYMRTGIEPASMIAFGYQRNLNPKFIKPTITTFAEWNFSAFRFSPKNSEVKVGGVAPLLQKNSFKIVNNLNLSAGSVSTTHFESKKFAVADEVALGFYKPKWFFALTAEYEKIYLNHIEHTDFYRENYYEDAVDGWYKGAGGMFQFGLETGRTFFEKYDVHVELKVPFTERFNSYGGSPAHLNLAIGYRF
ncbi:hypothetical protein [Maribellus sediminis]|uniref:hypothetical protein n=1 Tax=Maribellus sediminis TaxID=2696285 RepID=UPI0014311BC4|nr:hypothetical protein [Maribellus sediminis]